MGYTGDVAEKKAAAVTPGDCDQGRVGRRILAAADSQTAAESRLFFMPVKYDVELLQQHAC